MMMMSRCGAKVMVTSGSRLFSTGTVVHFSKPRVALAAANVRVPAMRDFSKMTFEKKKETTENDQSEKGSSGGEADQGNKGEQLIVSYWGVKPMKITKEDGTEWKWSCFRVRYILLYVLYCCYSWSA